MKRAIGWTSHALFLATVLLAIWSPVGAWWQWAATAVILLLIGAVLLGTPDEHAEGGEVGPPEDETVAGIVHEAESYGPRPKYGKRAE